MNETAPLQSIEHRDLLEALAAARDSLRALPPGEAKQAGYQAEQLKKAYENALYAANRLGELWVAARFDAGEFSPDQSAIPVKQLIEQAVASLHSKAEEANVKLTTKFETVPAILGDQQLLQSLMSNLLASTIGVSDQGTQIIISTFQRDREIIIKIEDQGDGISSRLFPNLVRARSDNPSKQSAESPADIGTLMVKPVIDAHDGRMWVERQGESGSALFLALPPVTESRKGPVEGQTKVLIVDDDTDGAFMLDQALTKGGYVTEVAHDGISGLAKARSADIGLVLLDIMLPGIDGFEVCNRLRSDPQTRDLPVVMISAKSRPEDQETGLRMGANDYLTKPLRLAEVLDKVSEFIEK